MDEVAKWLPPFYTARYVEIRSPVLSLLWLICGAGIVLYTLVHSLLGEHNYVQREVPNMDVTFWQDLAVDGRWWPRPRENRAAYCDTNYTLRSNEGMLWGSEHIGCKRPGETPGTFFYPSSNSMLVALSIAYGSDPQYNTSDVYLYEDIALSTLGFQLSFITSREHVSHVRSCKVVGDDEHPDGHTVQSRYEELYPKKDYGEGYLVLSVEDIMRAAGRNLDGKGSEGPLRLSGLEIVAKFDLRNYHKSFRWPFAFFNPFAATLANEQDCTVHFEVLRDQFTPVKWFYDGTQPVAVQHGLRLVAVGTGSVGYFSLAELLEKLLVAFAAFGFAQIVLDQMW
eukprot:TRINITY_DN20570_c0_g1_i2.p1 TRINITY_DN20570_c0_g1~~TRINITY_DN20570_c0_g1_i2.p1  ORF type:complete len:367 (-),score=50.66 TRINITY_DN20570_c0_g1_i2:78-1094(-)